MVSTWILARPVLRDVLEDWGPLLREVFPYVSAGLWWLVDGACRDDPDALVLDGMGAQRLLSPSKLSDAEESREVRAVLAGMARQPDR